MHILLGLFIIIAGTLLTWKSEWIFNNFGTIAFFEKYFHSAGGGRFGYKIVGIVAVFVGVLILTNIHQQVLQAIAGLFTFGSNQQ